jgi:hypothetical protein
VVLEIGDSLGEDLAWGMPAALAVTGDRFVGAAVGDTGLVATWFYNWPAHLKTLLAEYRPKVVVAFLGANDEQNFYANGRYDSFGTKAWVKVYAPRASDLLNEAERAGAKVLWVGMPPMANPSFTSAMRMLNEVFRHAVATHPKGADYLSTSTVLGNAQGAYRAALSTAAGTEPLRAPDGVHITGQGAALVAAAVVARLKKLGWA